MLDFIRISVSYKKECIEIYPKFLVKNTKDLMIRGGDFYAMWDENNNIWTTDEFKAIDIIDNETEKWYNEHKDEFTKPARVLYLWDSDTGMIDKWHKYLQRSMRDSYHQLDEKLIFSNMECKKEDYASKKLDYPLTQSDIPSYNKMMEVLYSPEERHKIEWAIGSIVSGDSKNIQKFIVLYGSAGTGKSTILNIIQDLFKGYYSVFDAKALGSKNDSFALEPFTTNPLIAIQHDGDLSKIEDNTRLNSVVSHEMMTVNAKYKSPYAAKFNAFIFMGTNKPVKITDAKSGILRRLIDVSPTGDRLSMTLYSNIMSQIKFELGGIAYHCLQVYNENPSYYDSYVPTKMMGASNDFYNYILDMFDVFDKDDGVSLKSAWESYQQYCEESNVLYPYSKMIFKEELKNYFREFEERYWDDDDKIRIKNYYIGFIKDKFNYKPVHTERAVGIKFEEQDSIFDELYSKCKAQYASENETPTTKWENVATKLSDIDTTKLHYVRLPKNHIVIDFDLKDKDGKKSFSKNLEAASKWPLTYSELSKSGEGIHLHYIYDGDVDNLSRLYSEDIEIKVFNGKSSLRRKLTKCNNQPIRTINSGLPTKGENKVVNFENFKNEKALRTIIEKNLRKEIHPGTKPSVDFIHKILEDAYNSGMVYDVSDMSSRILSFAANSTNHSDYCIKLVNKMKFKSEAQAEPIKYDDKYPIIFYDVEVFPNLFVIVWKAQGKIAVPVKMINPSKEQVEDLLKYRLVGFNCRRYDNHILYAAMMGYSNSELYKLSKSIISSEKGDRSGFFSEAYGLSYTDIYDYAAKKQGLKKWEIELGIHHQELGLPWDEPVPEDMFEKVAEYCVNDVIATEATWNATQGDFIAREMLVSICENLGSKATVNDTTNSLTTKIIFGNERHPNLVYKDLKEEFPEYSYILDENNKPHNMYKDIDVGFGGYVYAQPGMYENVVVFDVASMHPHSIIALNLFGEYTKIFEELVEARVAIKRKEYSKAKEMLNGSLSKYLNDEKDAKSVAQALKIAINSVYGLTAANFDNPFRDIRNKNNIVALRGALFMCSLKEFIEDMGLEVISIKTDSIKVVNPPKDMLSIINRFASTYGYTFEIENIFSKICLVNDAVFIAKCSDNDPDTPGRWTATGTQFAVPYVFKTLFSKEPIIFEDYCETKSVSKGDIYIDMNNDPDSVEDNLIFIGRVSSFCPIKENCGGGTLYRVNEGKKYAITGTKGYQWLESEMVKKLKKETDIDDSYYRRLVDEAIASINEYGDFEMFVS